MFLQHYSVEPFHYIKHCTNLCNEIGKRWNPSNPTASERVCPLHWSQCYQLDPLKAPAGCLLDSTLLLFGLKVEVIQRH